ncbi:MAG: methylmalonyl-CoA mutase [Candidatus Tectomicrobia bacterium]|uniref:Methylmalonyl-CoA mutase n=1 Tax=Tectimicrobiota bacterium TaxID=2528274 RepID=A0A932CN33_UNCTE|nr:methylmalonyl-CoA mutase [Candidatus Tectomicrobia bacterium]
MDEQEKLEQIKQHTGCWKAECYQKAAAKAPTRKEQFTTPSGIPIKEIFTPEDIAHLDFEKDIGYPGEHPYTRGIYPTMYRSRHWSYRPLSGRGAAEDGKERLNYLLQSGATALSLVPDFNVLFADRPDAPEALATLGKTGTAFCSLRDYEVYFEGIPLDQFSITFNETHFPLFSFCSLLAIAEQRGMGWDCLAGTSQNDALLNFHSCHFPSFPPKPMMRIAVDLIQFCAQRMPRWNPISISGYNIQESGTTGAQELGYAMVDGIAYLKACIDAGMPADQAASKFTFFFAAQTSFFEEIAKFRAARRMWAKITRERFGAQSPKACQLKFHTQTAGSSLTYQQPENNLIRTTLQALAAVLGGTQSMHVTCYDEAWQTPLKKAATLSVRTQQVLAYESGVADVTDPLAGSYYVEYLTDEIEKRAWEYVHKIDELGGVLRAIELGHVKRDLFNTASRMQEEIEHKERIVVGVNAFTMEEEDPFEEMREPIDYDQIRQSFLKRYYRMLEERDSQEVASSLERLQEAARTGESLVLPGLEAVKAYATVNEVMKALKEVFGTYATHSVLY